MAVKKIRITRRRNHRSLIWEYIGKSLLLIFTLGLYFPYFMVWVVDVIADSFDIEVEDMDNLKPTVQQTNEDWEKLVRKAQKQKENNDVEA